MRCYLKLEHLSTEILIKNNIIKPCYSLCSGFAEFEITYSDLAENISVTLSSKSGTVLLSPTEMQFLQPKWNQLSVHREFGVGNELKLVGCLDVINFALQSIQYFGYGNGTQSCSRNNFVMITCFFFFFVFTYSIAISSSMLC